MPGVFRDKDKLEAQKSVDSERKTKMLQAKSQVTENVRRLQRDMEQKVESLKNAYGRLLEQVSANRESQYLGTCFSNLSRFAIFFFFKMCFIIPKMENTWYVAL